MSVLLFLLFVVAVTAWTLPLIYSLFAPWWKTRAGRAVFCLYWMIALLVLHFVLEAQFGQAPGWVEVVLLLLLEACLLWTCYTIVSKQLRAQRERRRLLS